MNNEMKFTKYDIKGIEVAKNIIRKNGNCRSFTISKHCCNCPLSKNYHPQRLDCNQGLYSRGQSNPDLKIKNSKYYINQCRIRNIK